MLILLLVCVQTYVALITDNAWRLNDVHVSRRLSEGNFASCSLATLSVNLIQLMWLRHYVSFARPTPDKEGRESVCTLLRTLCTFAVVIIVCLYVYV